MNKLLSFLLTLGSLRYLMLIANLFVMMLTTVVPVSFVVANALSWIFSGCLALTFWYALNKSMDNYFNEMRSNVSQRPEVVDRAIQTERPAMVLTAVGENGFIERNHLRRQHNGQ